MEQIEIHAPSDKPPAFEHNFDYDPTYGYSLEQMLALEPPKPPADFADFWQRRYQRTLQAGPLDITLADTVETLPRLNLREIAYTSTDGIRIHGLLTLPPDGKISSIAVCGHGYGMVAKPQPDPILPGCACIHPRARGLGNSLVPGLKQGDVASHVLHGIESRDNYIHGGCVEDIWRAASAMIELYPDCREKLFFNGGSFSGGLGALALPWDPRFKAAFLRDPSFGNYPLRLQLPCMGSGRHVRERWLREPEIANVLQYFDAATSAGFIRIPCLVAASLFDPSVPPPGQFSVYNALPGLKALSIKSAGHFAHKDTVTEMTEIEARRGHLLQAWLNES